MTLKISCNSETATETVNVELKVIYNFIRKDLEKLTGGRSPNNRWANFTKFEHNKFATNMIML